MGAKSTFKFCSGDALVFDPSSDAAVLHSVISIDDETAPETHFAALRNLRYGVQCRVHL